ncbi:hypothetical protein STEG23_000039 [Scotinomys teguina]
MEVKAAAPRCQLLLIVLMAAMLLPGMKVSPLLIWRKIARIIQLQENIGKICEYFIEHFFASLFKSPEFEFPAICSS